MKKILSILLLIVLVLGARAEEPRGLRVALVQMGLESTLSENRDKMLRLTAQAMAGKPRVVVFPEGALAAPSKTPPAEFQSALAAMARAAHQHQIYIIIGTQHVVAQASSLQRAKAGKMPALLNHGVQSKFKYQLYVFGPQGGTLTVYDKAWGAGRIEPPKLVEIDGVPCSFILCADRWSRPLEGIPPVMGARIIFECSNNFDTEWNPALGYHWSVARAIRNTAFVIFTNAARENRFEAGVRSHGHTGAIAPDGTVLAGARDERDKIVTADLDLARATRAMALRRASHPLFKSWWAMGEAIYRGQAAPEVTAPELKSSEESVKCGFGQMACESSLAKNTEKIKKQIGQAAAAKMDLVVFPELAVTGDKAEDIQRADAPAIERAVAQIREATRAAKLTAVFGAPSFVNGKRRNSAYVAGPDGALLTRYDQIAVARPDLFEGGLSTRAMWFQVNGIWSVVSIGEDAAWSELAELAALRGARLHCHLRHDRNRTASEALIHDQLMAGLASFRMLTIVANPIYPELKLDPNARFSVGSGVWDDLEAGDWSAVKIVSGRPWEGVFSAPRIVPGPVNPMRKQGYWLKTLPQFKSWMMAGVKAMDVAEK